MSAHDQPQSRVQVPLNPTAISPDAVLGICTSMKPALGSNARSAARSLLSYALENLTIAYPKVFSLDLRDWPLPLFDGRLPGELGDPNVKFLTSCIERAGGLLISIPGYWCGVSGVFKNFIDVLCGPTYDMGESICTPLSGKPVGVIVVGADLESTRAATLQSASILLSTGAQLVGDVVSISDPRRGGTSDSSIGDALIALAADLAKRAYASSIRAASAR